MQTFEMSHKIRRELSDFPSTGMKMNISGGKKKMRFFQDLISIRQAVIVL